MPITITDVAAKAIKRITEEQKTANNITTDLGLRLGVKGGGCSGMSHSIGLDPESNPGDHIFESQGIRIFVDPKSYLYLNGTEVDYKEDPFQAGFVLNNPNSKHSCGCGSSFSV